MKKESIIISYYMETNGILTIEKISELVNKAGLNVDKEEMLEICKENNYIIKNDLIYLNDIALKLDEEEDLYEQKLENTYKEYSIEEIEKNNKELAKTNYITQIKDILKPKIKDKNKLSRISETIYYNTISGCDYGCNNMELLDEENINLTNRQEIWFDNLIDEIYWCAPSWELNGYCRIDLENNDLDEPSFEELSESDKADVYVNIYIALNGVMEIEKIISIIEYEHKIKLTNKELRQIVKKAEDLTITDKYIHTINLTEEDIEDLMECKDQVKTYRIIDDINKIAEDLLDTTSRLCFTCFEHNLDEEILEIFQALIVTGGVDKDIIKQIIKEEKIKLSSKKEESLIKELIDIQNNSRIWTLNGYKINELTATNY